MIVDCHTHIRTSMESSGPGTGLARGGHRGRGSGRAPLRGDETAHAAGTQPADRVFVLACWGDPATVRAANDEVAAYVQRHRDRLIGFAAVDPTRPRQALDELRRAHDELGMKGLNLCPASQGFHPAHSCAMRVYAEACRLRLPVVIHQDLQPAGEARMEYARPYLLDEVAREFPDLRIVVSQLGYPWTEEATALLGKHAGVFADVGGLLGHQWAAYNALLSAHQAGVTDSLLFGSDFPHATTAECIETLYSINQFCHGTSLPTIPREQLRQIVERDALRALGVESETVAPRAEPDTTLIRAEE